MSDQNASEMPRYRCHQEVWALKIGHVYHENRQWFVEFEDRGYARRHVSNKFIDKHAPVVGGYYVVYKDGYESFSPAEAFEEGYSRI